MNFMTDLLDDYCFKNYGHKKWKQEFDDKGQEVITFEPIQINRNVNYNSRTAQLFKRNILHATRTMVIQKFIQITNTHNCTIIKRLVLNQFFPI